MAIGREVQELGADGAKVVRTVGDAVLGTLPFVLSHCNDEIRYVHSDHACSITNCCLAVIPYQVRLYYIAYCLLYYRKGKIK
jgi:hypothetical protein